MNKEKIINIIKDIIKENYIILENDETLDGKIERKLQNNQPITNEIDKGWKHNQDYFLFYYINCDNSRINIKSIEETIKVELNQSLINENETYGCFNLYLIFNRLEDKLIFDREQKECKFKKEILDEIQRSEKNNNVSPKKLELKTIFTGTCIKDTFNIKIDDRIRSLETKRKKYVNDEKKEFGGLDINGYVFNANLKDVVSIYNILGNELFDKNLRYSIKDELDVDSHIKNTLKTNPDEFWYLNNGITMIVEDDDFKLKRSNSINISYGDSKIISVINGAQTISASASYFYESKNKAILNEKEPSVMLRVIHIKKIGYIKKNKENINKLCNKEINKISISLNRQKPIKQEDIAYTTSFVDSINHIYDKVPGKYGFNIAKRSAGLKVGYDLLEFAKLVKSYLVQEPGKALTQGARTLLTLNENGELKHTEIFKEELSEGNEKIDNFNKYYKPVNFAASLMEFYSDNAKDSVSSYKEEDLSYYSLKSNIASYGKLYFISYVIYILNGKKVDDFSDFDVKFVNEDFKEYIKEFIDLLAELIIAKNNNNNIIEVNINDFKKEEIYNYFKEYDKEENQLSDRINQFQKNICNYFNVVNDEACTAIN